MLCSRLWINAALLLWKTALHHFRGYVDEIPGSIALCYSTHIALGSNMLYGWKYTHLSKFRGPRFYLVHPQIKVSALIRLWVCLETPGWMLLSPPPTQKLKYFGFEDVLSRILSVYRFSEIKTTATDKMLYGTIIATLVFRGWYAVTWGACSRSGRRSREIRRVKDR